MAISLSRRSAKKRSLLRFIAFLLAMLEVWKTSCAFFFAMKKDRDSLFVSMVTAWEVALLHKKGRLFLPLPRDEFMQRALMHYGVHELQISREIVMAGVALPDIHNDPFDRILVAEALHNKCRIITKDGKIPLYPGVKVIW